MRVKSVRKLRNNKFYFKLEPNMNKMEKEWEIVLNIFQNKKFVREVN